MTGFDTAFFGRSANKKGREKFPASPAEKMISR
jgi:hypothetical protein